MNDCAQKRRDENVLMLFDVDGTLTQPRKCILKETEDVLHRLKSRYKVAVVGGSDLEKIIEQIGVNLNVTEFMDYCFAENGLVGYKNGVRLPEQSMLSYLGEDLIQRFLNFSLHYMSQLKLPAKRGTFVEFRTGMINLCPVGRSCSQSEREEFNAYDKKHNVRKDFVSALCKEFDGCGLQFAIGGQISIDAYPTGWDKRYCLNHIGADEFKVIHFFGDKCSPDGNDYALYMDDRVIGHAVESPKHTIECLQEFLS